MGSAGTLWWRSTGDGVAVCGCGCGGDFGGLAVEDDFGLLEVTTGI